MRWFKFHMEQYLTAGGGMKGKMELEKIPDYPERNGGATREEVVEQVRVGLVRYLERHREVTTKDVAKACGYDIRSIYKFIQRDNNSLVMAQKIVTTFDEIGQGMPCVCQHCGRLPHFVNH